MTDAEQNFIACIKNLESFNLEYIQAKKQILETRSLTQIQPTPLVLPTVTMIATTTTASVAISDYTRICRMYCVMLWTYWEALKIRNSTLEELRLIRNCVIHHEGDMSKYSQDANFGPAGKKLISLTNGKPYVQQNILVISDTDLITFTSLVKTGFIAATRVTF